MVKRVTFSGMMLAAAMIFSYIERLIPLEFIAPGVKIGLANCVFLLCLLTLGIKEAIFVNLARIFLTVLLFGNPVSLIFSLSGAVASMAVSITFFKFFKISFSGLGAVSGITHNLAQILAAALVTGSFAVLWYFPILLISGAVCGFATGAAAETIAKRVKKYF